VEGTGNMGGFVSMSLGWGSRQTPVRQGGEKKKEGLGKAIPGAHVPPGQNR